MYTFGATTFSRFIWIKGGGLFSNVTLVEVEMVNSGAYSLEVVSSDGKVLSVGKRDNGNGGWSTFSFAGSMVPPVTTGMSPYKIRLVNGSSGKREVKMGNVHY